ncbi:MAG: PilN domain-containing protein [Romboutsia sp.]|uniref:PilN domain-containing protein n=1 Tax=Romboutsia sp. TaxID=1965302 RepID=UPI003F37BCC1
MTKLYISYYGDSVSIVEGSYKKNKFNIDDILFMTSSDVEPDYSDKYNLLKHALRSKEYKAKKAVLCLNTLDVIVKSNKIPKIDAKDLDGLMSLEIDELISLERDEYTFSYEVMRQIEEQGEEFLDLVLAGIETHEVNSILRVFEECNLKLEYIDILPTAYSRVLKEVEYTDMMIVNTGQYSTSIDIYKEDSLYIHDNVPVRLTENAQGYEYMRLVDEANGLMNYYSSRNFGKTVDSILLIGNYANNQEVVESFKKVFSSEIIPGIESLYDIYSDIAKNLSEENLNKIVEIIGCMLRDKKKSPYMRMNLLPEDIKIRNRQNNKAIKALKVVPIILLALYTPVMALEIMENNKQKELQLVQTQIEQIKIEYKQISNIEKDIKKKEEEIKIYDMLISKEPKWGALLTSIDKNIPFKVQLDNLSLSYVSQNNQEEENINEDSDENSNEENIENQNEESVYDKIPNFITITGKSQTPSLVGQFVYNLKLLPYFEDIKLSGVTEQSSGDEKNRKTSYSFSITASIKDGVIKDE